jgi:hypothetical protein
MLEKEIKTVVGGPIVNTKLNFMLIIFIVGQTSPAYDTISTMVLHCVNTIMI